jgi:chromosome segregation ATPase
MGLRDKLVNIGVLKSGDISTPKIDMVELKPSAKNKPSARSSHDTDPPIGADGDAFYKTLEKALRKTAGDGFDYLKFKDITKKMMSHIGDEAARYAAAGATAEAMKMSADDLISSAQDYLKTLDKQQSLFDDACVDTQAEIDKDTSDLKDVTKKIAELESQKALLQSEIADNTQKINDDTASFTAGYEQLSDEIKQDISKIKKYLKA